MANQGSCFGFKCAQVTLISLNVLYVIVGCVLIGVAAAGRAKAYIVDIGIMGGIIACGVFLLIIAIVGLVGTCLHHQVTLFFYMSILFLLFLVQFVVACACLALNESERYNLIKATWNSGGKNNPSVRYTIQSFFDCCGGLNSSKESLDADGITNCSLSSCCHNRPESPCCSGKWPTNGSVLNSEIASTNYTESTTTEQPSDQCPCDPCWQKVDRDISGPIKAAGGVGLFFSFTELIGVWLAFRFRNLKNPFADPNQFL